jgi:hypothetical protein
MTEPEARPEPGPAPDPAANPSLSVVAPVSPSEQGATPVLVTDLASKTLAVKEGETFLYSDLRGTSTTAGRTVSGCTRTTRGSCRTSV